jgi:hypothetical protein
MPRSPGATSAPTPTTNVDTETGEVTETEVVTENGATNGSVEISPNTGKPKRQYKPKQINVPEGVSEGWVEEPVAEVPPPKLKRGGPGRRGPNPAIPALINKIVASPDTWFRIGNFRSQTPADGLWKEAGVKFRHAPFKHTDGEGNETVVEGLYSRYAIYETPKEGNNEQPA